MTVLHVAALAVADQDSVCDSQVDKTNITFSSKEAIRILIAYRTLP